MEISPHYKLVTSGDHLVDWQLARTFDAAPHAADERNTRERIRSLEAHAMTLLRAAVGNATAAAAQRSLAALDAEIAILRADLASRRAS
jgi:hypothetical protein